MRLEFHRQVAADISRILDYYENIGEPQLAEEFYAELKAFFHKAAHSPENYAGSRAGYSPGEFGKISISLSFSRR